MKTQHDHHDRLSVRLSVIISRLLAGESLELKVLADEFGVSERTLQRDFQQRLIHLDLEHRSGSYRLIRQTGGSTYPIHLRLYVIQEFQESFRLRTAS